jgi:hypothetical protein
VPEKKTLTREVRIAGQRFRLRSADIRKALTRVDPEPIASHFVVVGNRRYPPKQVICAVTGLDRADFTTHQARRTLMRLGFRAGRVGSTMARITSGATLNADARVVVRDHPGDGLADELRTLLGQWVAVRGDDVIHAAETPQQLVGWLTEHGQKAESMFRVPEDELSATGLAPL